MALSSTDRWKILSNIVAQKGTDNVDLHAELAKAENMINVWDTQKMIRPPITPQVTQPISTNVGQPVQESLPPENSPIQNE